MADRSVTVRLRADISQYKRSLAEAAVATQSFGKSTDSAGKQIDKLSGRMKLLADAALIGGPALLRLGAGALPVLSAGLAGIGAAAGGIGVTVLAMHGLGDALKAIDKAHTEPTAENFQAMRVELEKLGPAGAEFAHYLDNLRPVLSDLQNTARAGMFPGLEDGIDALLTRGPEVTKIINRLSQGMGDLARDAGESLSSEAWSPFFNYVKTDARPTLEAFGHATGNVALGMANLLVAFAPLSRDFTGGLEGATKAFAEWSMSLDDNASFQEFLDYVREAGPQAVAFLGAVGGALSSLAQAAAPFGAVVLPALTAMANAFAMIAKSPIGPGLYTAAAGMIAFNRATSIAEKTSSRFTTAWGKLSTASKVAGGVGGLGLLATSLTDVDDKAGLANTTMFSMAGLLVGGPWGAAIGAGIGLTQDYRSAQADLNDELEHTEDIIQSGTLKEKQAEYKRLSEEIDDSSFSIQRWLFGTREQQFALDELGDSMHSTDALAAFFASDLGLTARQLQVAADSAGSFSGALAELNGWFDKRAAVRGYKDAIDDLRESMKDGFTRDDAANLDAIGTSILQVAQNIKSPKIRGDFLAGARAQLEDMANHAGPKAAAAIQQIIDKFDDSGLTHPKPIAPTVDDRRARHDVDRLTGFVKGQFNIMDELSSEPTIDADDNPFRQTYGAVKGAIREADHLRANPKVDVDPGNSLSVIGMIQAHMAALHDRTLSITTINRSVRGGAVPPEQHADGGTVGGQRHPYGDKVLIHAAPGEEIISNRHGQADRFRSDRASGRIPGYADGGSVGGSQYQSMLGDGRGGGTINVWTDGVYSVAKALKVLKAELDAASKSVDKEKQNRDDLVAAEQAFMSSVGGAYSKADLFSGGLDSFDVGLEANTNDTRAAQAALATASGNGLDGALYQALAASGNLTLLQQFAGLSASQIDVREQQFATQSAAQTGLGQSAADAAGFTAAIKDQNKELQEATKERRELKLAVKSLEEKLPDKVEDGARKGIAEREKRTRAHVRTGR